MHKKPLIYLTFLLFLFTVCSSCSKSPNKCRFLPKIEKSEVKNEESTDLMGNKFNTYAQINCKY